MLPCHVLAIRGFYHVLHILDCHFYQRNLYFNNVNDFTFYNFIKGTEKREKKKEIY